MATMRQPQRRTRPPTTTTGTTASMTTTTTTTARRRRRRKRRRRRRNDENDKDDDDDGGGDDDGDPIWRRQRRQRRRRLRRLRRQAGPRAGPGPRRGGVLRRCGDQPRGRQRGCDRASAVDRPRHRPATGPRPENLKYSGIRSEVVEARPKRVTVPGLPKPKTSGTVPFN